MRRNYLRDRDAAGDRWRDVSGYHPVTAQQLARDRRQRLAKLTRNDGLRAHIADRLRTGWLPQQIAGRLKLARATGEADFGLCHETIHRHIYGQSGRADELYRCLLGLAGGAGRGTDVAREVIGSRMVGASNAGLPRFRPVAAWAIGRPAY